MLPQVESLLIVQNRDQKIDAVKKDLDRIPLEKTAAEQKLSSDTQSVADAKTALQHNEVAIKNVEADIATRRTTITKLRTQQFETKKNEEYAKFAQEIIRYGEMVDELETQELELMEVSDDLKSKLASANEALATTQKEVDQDIASLEIKGKENQKRLQELEADRDSLTADIDDNLMALYNRLRVSKGNDPVVPLKGSQCSGCHMKVTASTSVKVNSEKEITQCENCGRILYPQQY